MGKAHDGQSCKKVEFALYDPAIPFWIAFCHAMGRPNAISVVKHARLARIPAKWNHFAENDSRQINYVGANPCRQSLQLWRDLLWNLENQ
jgi:hypothetical protein